VLSLTLASVCLWAGQDFLARRARNEWQAPLQVGLVILSRGAVDERALATLRQRTAVLEQRLTAEFARYRGDADHRTMIRIIPYGPVPVSEVPPDEPQLNASYISRALQAYRLWRYTSRVDAAAGVPTRELDSRVYVVAEPGHDLLPNSVAGFGETHGRIGVARVDLADDTVDLALFVAAHELLHTLGASDKYEADGSTSFPYGLAEPELVPTFPQRYAEVMARNRVLSATNEVPPETLSELRVGRWTAEEIGWIRGRPARARENTSSTPGFLRGFIAREARAE